MLFCLFLRHAAVEQRGSALFHSILLLITRRAHQTRHNYSHSLLTYSNAASHLRDNYEQFFSHVESLLTKEIAHWKKICCAMGEKRKGKKREWNRCAAVVISKAGKLLAGVYREICQWEEGSKWAKAQCRSDEGRGGIIEQGLLYFRLDSIDKLSRNFRQLY